MYKSSCVKNIGAARAEVARKVDLPNFAADLLTLPRVWWQRYFNGLLYTYIKTRQAQLKWWMTMAWYLKPRDIKGHPRLALSRLSFVLLLAHGNTAQPNIQSSLRELICNRHRSKSAKQMFLLISVCRCLSTIFPKISCFAIKSFGGINFLLW